MGPERIELSASERERLKVLQQVEEGHLKQVEAARRLRLTERQVRRLQIRLRSEGDGGIVHGLRGRASNRKIPARLRQPCRVPVASGALCGLWPHPGRRASGTQRNGGEPGNGAELDEYGGAVAAAPPESESGACVAAPA